ncbi:MAG: endolytic transglycosylase MltG [Clostridia bacterium]|nr:endolytic transglycosylase MltG [Clostridia bacterium]
MNPPLLKNIKTKRIHWHTKLVVLLVLIALGLGIYFYNQLGPVDLNDQVDRLFVVNRGATSMQIAKNLAEEGLIKNIHTFIIYNRLTCNIKKLKAGHFLLNPAMSVQEITAKLVEGKVATISFTIPEGYTLKQIADVLVKKGITTEHEFWAVVKEGEFNFSFIKDLPLTENRLEGYLFPDTYIIPLGISTEEVIRVMLKRFDSVFKQLPPNNTGLTTHELVTLASIVEGECLLDRERPIVASVFLNRLKIGQKLEACATVQYALGKRTARVLIEDTKIESPYNTYVHEGLPPGPIGCPGEASLRAVLEPADTSYYYFVAKKDNSGEHVFSKTFDEHKRNKWKLGY